MVKLLFAFLLPSLALAAPSPFGRFVGTVHHDEIGREQLAKLDFIASREEKNELKLAAVLTLHFGDFKSREYVAYHFENVTYNPLTGSLVFGQAGAQVTIVVNRYTGDVIEGELQSSFSGDNVKIELHRDDTAAPKLPLIEPVWGEYEGTCPSRAVHQKVPARLQLYTYRSSDGASDQIGDPFRAYRIKGLWGEDQGDNCLFTHERWCHWNDFNRGAFNFYRNELTLFGASRTLICSFDTDGLVCDGCKMKRVSSETNGPRALKPPATEAKFTGEPRADQHAIQDDSDLTSLRGEYRGYVHHEYLDVYQAGSLSLLTYQGTSLEMAAVGRLYFGDWKSPEVIAYEFAKRTYPNPLTAPSFVFIQPQSDVDAIVQVTSIGKGVVKGVWYSHLFGRVGTFEFRKKGLPALPPRAKLMEPVSGHYEGREWEFGLVIRPGAGKPNTENPFAPLVLGGWWILPDIIASTPISGGSYDFYTGRIALDFGDKATHVGLREERRKLMLKRTWYPSLTPFRSHALEPHRLIDDLENTP